MPRLYYLQQFIFIAIVFLVGGNLFAQKAVKPKNIIYTKVDVEAALKGGSGAWSRFMNKNLKCPDISNDEVSTTKTAVFIVRKDGTIDSLKLVGGADDSIGQAYLRAIQLTSGAWTPAKIKGKVVDSYIKRSTTICLETE